MLDRDGVQHMHALKASTVTVAINSIIAATCTENENEPSKQVCIEFMLSRYPIIVYKLDITTICLIELNVKVWNIVPWRIRNVCSGYTHG